MKYLLLLFSFITPFEHVNAQEFDIVIMNGRVMDPASNTDAIRNIGITEGKIAEISTRAITGKERIDASGLVVAPVFIALHAHGQNLE
ncbi:MAG: D-glutamate deacylase, partial [Bacteroidetes bacterium]|nr:D-glutamate deacylase [Bacteroidota bacterium]